MRRSVSGSPGGSKATIGLIAAMSLLLAYMTWVGVSGHALPRWLLWAASVL